MQPIREISLITRALRVSFAMLGLFVLAFCFVPTLISEASAAQDVSAGVNWSAVSLTLDPDYGNGSVGSSGHGDVIFDGIIPSQATDGNLGTMRVVKKTIGIETTGRYYTVYLSTDSSSNSLDLVGDTATSISPISATWNGTDASAPKTFSNAGWGFAVPGSPIANTFSSASVYAAYDALSDINMTYANNPTIYNTGKWAAVPALTSPQQIWKATTTNVNGFGGEHGDLTNNHFDVYYATIVDTDFVAGSYENQLVYTALANSSAIDTITNNISRSLQYGTSGDTETLSFDLTQSMPTITKDKVEVYLIPHSVTNSNGYVATNLDAYKTSTYKCIIGSAANDFTITNNKASLNCSIPTNPDGKTAGGANMEGEYDFLVTIPTYGYNYISKYHTTDSSTGTDSEVASFIYAGLQTKARNNTDYLITEMQEMTGSVCKNTNVYDSTASNATTFSLRDVRDNISYNVRKLGENCWMVQNLRFVGTTLTPETSDVATATTINYSDIESGGVLWERAGVHSGVDEYGDPTTWYAYDTATALTISGSDLNVEEASHSICPSGWKLPSYTEFSTIVEKGAMFNPVITGFYEQLEGQEQLVAHGTGYWWSSTILRGEFRYGLLYQNPSLRLDGLTFGSRKTNAFAVRCIARD
ncbi:hypothetical protein IKE71_02875 [Candidatus Saccharibacteria bacterium]|nr:hypothetical protein [Candidatus Saccharibacteria bacterium]